MGFLGKSENKASPQVAQFETVVPRFAGQGCVASVPKVEIKHNVHKDVIRKVVISCFSIHDSAKEQMVKITQIRLGKSKW